MPYIEQADRDKVKKNIRAVSTPGELNFLIFSYLLDIWNKHPRYDTIHCFKRDFVTFPKDNSLLKQLRGDFAHIFTVSDIYAGAACAYDEFMRRIGNKYEDKKISLNGDIPEIAAALDAAPHPAPTVEVPSDAMDSAKITVLSDKPEIEVK